MEIVEMYCDLILARFGLVTQMKELDEGLAEAISSLVWVAPRMHTDIQVLLWLHDFADLFRNQTVDPKYIRSYIARRHKRHTYS